ncbi:alpha/beta hydrolase [Rhodococcus sp. BH5]|uniref:alpha/beta hydrolase n=1 Tax=Rhodococcus sp. BH5 TaxID=2871702 RepID=UPI0022CD9558|nr:alpha/beta hydrolase [Rhodococcus sp. BH5]MCZ9632373.1 alpha/beta hydrolase [Rhodococcus sp. BH5]
MRTRDSTVWHWNVSPRARVIFCLTRTFVKPMFTLWPTTERGIHQLERLDAMADKLPKPKNLDIEPFTLGGVPSEKVQHPRKAQGELAGATILYFHGGGFVFCGLATHRALCGLLSAKAGVPVISVRYRQLPEGSIGTSVKDAMAAYTALLETAEDPNKIVVAGDSAGGYLAMKVAEIAALRGITRPAAVVGYSPLLNVNLEDHDPDFMKRDAYLPMSQVEKLKDRWLEGPDEIPGAQSPINADASLIPPSFLVSAEYELMRPDVEIMTENLIKAGQAVETHIWSGQIHAFPVIGKALREGKAIVDLTIKFLERTMASQNQISA